MFNFYCSITQDNNDVAKLVKLIMKLKDQTVDINNMDEILVSEENFNDEEHNTYDVPKRTKTLLAGKIFCLSENILYIGILELFYKD